MNSPDPDSIRLALDLAWRDHHHARDQTWKAIEIEGLLGAGLIGADWQIQNVAVTCTIGLLVIFAGIFGILISLHHRRVEIRAFTHILNCERALGLYRDDLLSPDTIKLPSRLSITDAFRPTVQNTAAFILRMHMAIIMFAVLYVIGRVFLDAPTAG